MPVTAKENMEPPHRKDSTGGGGGLEFVTTRFPTAATAPRVSVNPLQFVKVAPPKLFGQQVVQSAVEREKEEKERRRKLSQEAEEDWQANLDNWKSSRRKRVEHIVERVEEVRRVEQEDSVWAVTGRRKSKTFNEMMEERSSRGMTRRSSGLLGLSYPADDEPEDDVLGMNTSGGEGGQVNSATSKEQQDWGAGSDRGTSATSSLSGLDSGGQLSEAETEREGPSTQENGTGMKAQDNNNNNDRSNNGNEGDNGNHGEGPEEEIYTYERAIQEYVNYTERRNSGGVAIMERKNGEVIATLPDERNGVPGGPSSPRKQSNGPSTLESIKNSAQSWTVDEETEDGSVETEEETEDEILRRISFKEKLASFRNLESSAIKSLPVSREPEMHVPEPKKEIVPLVQVKSEDQVDKVVVYHANEDSGINTGDASQSDGEEEISTPVRRNSKQGLANKREPSLETVVKEQKYDGVAISDAYVQKNQGGGSTVITTELLVMEYSEEQIESSNSLEDNTIQNNAHSTPVSSPPPAVPIKDPILAQISQDIDINEKVTSFIESSPTKSPRTPPVPPPRPTHKRIKTPSPPPKQLENVTQAASDDICQTLESAEKTVETFIEIVMPTDQEPELQGNNLSSSPVRSSTTDVMECSKVAPMTTAPDPLTSEEMKPLLTSEITNPACEPSQDKVDTVTSEVDQVESVPTNTTDSEGQNGELFPEQMKEVSQDLSIGSISVEKNVSTQPIDSPKIVSSLLSDGVKVAPLTLVELRGLEALDALLASPPPPTPLPPILDLTSEDVHVVGGLGFALGTPAKALTPPTEKPPPPPTSSPPSTPTGARKSSSNAIGDFRRRNSTKRIRKEIRRKRSDFLGIDAGHEGSDGDGEDIADEIEPPPRLSLPRDVPTSSECTAEEEEEDDGEYGEEDVEQELVRLQEQEPSPSTTHCGGLDVSSSPLPGETEEEEEEERSSCQTQETDSGVELTEKDRDVRRGKKIAEVEEIGERRMGRMQSLYDNDGEKNSNINNQYYGPVVAEPASAMHHQSMQDVRMREPVNEEPIIRSREEPIHNLPPAMLRRSLPDFAHAAGEEVSQPQPLGHPEQPQWRRSQPPPVPPHKPRPPPVTEAPSPTKANMRQAQLRALNVPPKPRIIPTDGWVSPEVRSSYSYEWNGSPQHPLSPQHHMANHPLANSLPRNHMPMQNNSAITSPERRSSHPIPYPNGSPVKNGGMHHGNVDAVQREEAPRRKKTEGYNYQHWLIQEAEHRRITEMQERRRSQNGIPSRESSVEEPVTNGSPARGKHLPDSIIQTLTQRVQGRTAALSSPNHRPEPPHPRPEGRPKSADMGAPLQQQVQNSQRHHQPQQRPSLPGPPQSEKMLSVSGKKKCSHCSQELGRGAAMIIESLRLFYHIGCFRCCVCHAQLGDGLVGADVRVRAGRLHCHHCYSSDDGVKFSCV